MDMVKDGVCKMDKTKNAVMLEIVGEGRILLELTKTKLAGPLAKKDLPAEGWSRTGVFNPRPGTGISQNTMRYEY